MPNIAIHQNHQMVTIYSQYRCGLMMASVSCTAELRSVLSV